MRLLALVSGATFLASVSAHATFQQIWINGVDAGSSCARLPKTNSPIESVLSDDMACNVSGTSSGVCSINAGDEVTVEMHQQNGDRSCKSEAIGGNHYGPVTVYMAQVPDAKTAVGSSADWFKVSESGLVSNNPVYWAVQVLNDNCGHYTFKVPSDLAAGNYLLRAEVLALHVAGSVGGAQFYPACFQVNVSGSGNAKPPTVKIPGAFSATDPGILFNLYGQVSTYQIPGPTPYGTSPATVATTAWPTTPTWNTALQPSTVPTVVPGVGSGASSSSAVAVTTTAVTTSSTQVSTSSSTVIATPTTTSTSQSSPSSSSVAIPSSSSTAVTTQVQSTSTSSRFITSTVRSSSAVATPSNSAGAVPLYGQCGGLNYKGSTVCAEGTCTYSNDWYSQCVLVPW